MAYGLDLQTSQLPSLQDSRLALTFRYPNMEVSGGVMHKYSPTTQIVSKPMEMSWKLHNPLLQYKVAGEYYSHVLEYFSGPNMTI